MQQLRFTNEGVEWFYSKKATLDNKPQAWLEAVDEQLSMIRSLEKIDNNLIIEYGLKELDKIKEVTEALQANWRSGNMDGLAEVGVTELLTDFPSVYKVLLSDRNKDWLPQIENMLTDDTIEFVLVGALHLAGPDSVLTLLENKGYKVTQL